MPKITRAYIEGLKARGRKRRSALTQKQKRQVTQLAKRQIMKTAESKHTHWVGENQNLYHNMTEYHTGLFRTSQGFDSNDAQGHTGFPAGTDIRIGDEIVLKNINLRMWVSNKYDRPNVMYRVILFTYNTGETVDNNLVFFTQGNKMLDRINNKKVTVLASRYIKSGPSYAQTEKERSQLITMNVNYKNGKKIKYADSGSAPKDKDLGLCVVAYDAYGTAQTDNICSYAHDLKLTFKDP